MLISVLMVRTISLFLFLQVCFAVCGYDTDKNAVFPGIYTRKIDQNSEGEWVYQNEDGLIFNREQNTGYRSYANENNIFVRYPEPGTHLVVEKLVVFNPVAAWCAAAKLELCNEKSNSRWQVLRSTEKIGSFTGGKIFFNPDVFMGYCPGMGANSRFLIRSFLLEPFKIELRLTGETFCSFGTLYDDVYVILWLKQSQVLKPRSAHTINFG